MKRLQLECSSNAVGNCRQPFECSQNVPNCSRITIDDVKNSYHHPIVFYVLSLHWHAAKLVKSVQQILRNIGSERTSPVRHKIGCHSNVPWGIGKTGLDQENSRKYLPFDEKIVKIGHSCYILSAFKVHPKYILSIPTAFCLNSWTLKPYSAAIPGAFWLHSCSIRTACPNMARILKIVNSGWLRLVPFHSCLVWRGLNAGECQTENVTSLIRDDVTSYLHITTDSYKQSWSREYCTCNHVGRQWVHILVSKKGYLAKIRGNVSYVPYMSIDKTPRTQLYQTGSNILYRRHQGARRRTRILCKAKQHQHIFMIKTKLASVSLIYKYIC